MTLLRQSLAFTCLLAAATASMPARAAAPEYPAVLAGHAILPADATVMPPADAPADLKVTGKFTGPDNRRVDTIGALKGKTPASRTRTSRASPATPCRSRASRCRAFPASAPSATANSWC